jgi:ferredoxin
MLYIDPEECIDCGACVPECPVEAIFPEDEVPEQWLEYIDINYEWFGQKR